MSEQMELVEKRGYPPSKAMEWKRSMDAWARMGYFCLGRVPETADKRGRPRNDGRYWLWIYDDGHVDERMERIIEGRMERMAESEGKK